MGKNRLFESGDSKNQNKCSIFPSAYKLLHPHTNFIFKHPIKPHKIPTKSHFPATHSPKSQYRPQYRKTPLKSTLSHTTQHHSKPVIQTSFFLYKYKILTKSTLLPIYKLHAKFYNNISISIIIQTILNICRPQ